MKRLVALLLLLSLTILPSCGFIPNIFFNEKSEFTESEVSFVYSEPEYKEYTPKLNGDGEPLVILDYEVNASDMYYRSLLSKEQRKVYDIVATAVANHEDSVAAPILSGGSFVMETILESYYNDHPEVFYLSGDINYSEDFTRGTVTINFEYTVGKETTEKYLLDIKKAEEEYLSYITADMTQYEAAVIIHDLLCNNISYPDVTEETVPEVYTLFGALVNKSAVCSGYAHAFKYLCNKVGVKVINVTGTAGDESHQWNMVTIGNDNFFVDVTWDDPQVDTGEQITRYQYFGLTNNELAKTHTILGSFSLPSCDKTGYNYCDKNGFVINDEDETTDVLVKAIFFTVEEKPQYVEDTYDIFLKINTDTCNYEDTCDIILYEFSDAMDKLANTTFIKFSRWSISYYQGQDIIPYMGITIVLE